MQVTLSIDPAAQAGAALFIDGELTGHCDFDGSTFTTSHVALLELCKNLPAEVESAICVIEDGFSAYGKGNGLTLARRRGMVQSAAEAIGFRQFVFIAPITWQQRILGQVPKGQTKPASIAQVLDAHKINVSADVADSINIGDYFIQYGLSANHKSTKVEIDGRRIKKTIEKAQHPITAPRSIPKARRARPRKPAEPGGAVSSK